MEQNIPQIVQKAENLPGVKISFSCLDPDNCPFVVKV